MLEGAQLPSFLKYFYTSPNVYDKDNKNADPEDL